MSTRKYRLIDCSPHWVRWDGRDGEPNAVYFECPEGHEGCSRVIPFTPALDGSEVPVQQRNGAHWQRTGDTFETLTLSPSIRGLPSYPDRAAALAAGCIEEYLRPSMFCALHIFIRDGAIEFCGDSR